MFRTAILRCSFSAVRAAARIPLPRAATGAGLLPSSRVFAPATVSSIQSFLPARMYSASQGLTKEAVEDRILSLLRSFDKVNTDKLSPVAHFTNDLGLDSLDSVEVVMAIEEEFSIEIPDKDADAIHSVGDAVEYILNQPDAV